MSNSIAKKLLLGVILSSSLVSILITCFQLFQEYRSQIEVTNQHFDTLMQINGQTLEVSIWDLNQEQIDSVMDGFKSHFKVDYILLEFESIEDKTQLKRGQIPERFLSKKFFLESHGQEIGTIEFFSNADNVYTFLGKELINILFINLGKTLLVSLIILFVFNHLLTRHLLKITNHFKMMSFSSTHEKLKLDRRGKFGEGEDELSVLVKSINNLITSLNAYQNDLKEKVKESNSELSLTQERLESVIKNSGVGIWEWSDNNQSEVYLSPQIYHLLGYQINGFTPSSEFFNSIIHPVDKLKIQEIFGGNWRKKSFSNLIVRFKCKDGEFRWFSISGNYKVGDQERIIGSFEDVDSQQKNLIALEASNSIVNKSLNEIYICDTQNLQIYFVNESAVSNLGYSEQEILSYKFFDLFPEETSVTSLTKIIEAKIVYALEQGGFISSEFEREDGSKYDTQISVQKVEYNSVDCYCFIVTDITEIKQAQKENLRKVSDILSATPSCLKILDKKGRILHMNKQGLELVGASSLESIFKASAYDIVTEPFRDEFRKFTEKICSGEKGTMSFEILNLKNERRWLETYAAPYKLPNGEISLIAITNDISKRVATEKDYEQQKAIAQHNAKLASIGELAAGVGHEINNPLTIASGYLSLLLKKGRAKDVMDTSDLIPALEKISIANGRIAKIVDGLRNFTHSGIGGVSSKSFAAVDAISETYELINEIYSGQSIELDYKDEVKVKDLCINGSRGKFQQILMNLLSNAKDAVEEKFPKKIGIHFFINNSDKFCLYVNDNGYGIPSEIQDKVFDHFFTTKEVNKGTGLGLSLIFNFVQEMGGEISLDSEVGIGTTVKIELPYFIAKEEQSVDFKVDKVATASERKPIHVLLCDDEEDIRELLSVNLLDAGMEVTTANNGKEAYDLLVSNSSLYDIIISDIQMPIMNGEELLRAIRANNEIHQPKFVVISGGVTLRFDDKNSEFGRLIDGYLLKPFETEAMIEMIESCLENKDEAA